MGRPGQGGRLPARFSGTLRFKLDENMPRRAADSLFAAGHDVSTVADEGLVGQPDPPSPRRLPTETACSCGVSS